MIMFETGFIAVLNLIIEAILNHDWMGNKVY